MCSGYRVGSLSSVEYDVLCVRKLMQFTDCGQRVYRSHWPKMQLSGCHNGNEVRNAACVETQISKALTE